MSRIRGLWLAVIVSILCHFFWFFFIAIDVSIPLKEKKTRSKIVFLGPLVDETVFRSLAALNPPLPRTFYRGITEFAPPMDLPIKTMGRQAAGTNANAPIGKKSEVSLRKMVAGSKQTHKANT